jgi:effector-binding domain-containing protein
MKYDIKVREVGSQPILGVRAVVRTLELVQFFDEACNQMKNYLAKAGVRTAGPAMSIWHSAPGQIPDGFDIETCIPIENLISPADPMRSRELPAGLQAFTVHYGAYDDMGNAFEAVWKWIQEHGYEMVGPPRDVVLIGPNETSDPSTYRTEIVYPVVSIPQ